VCAGVYVWKTQERSETQSLRRGTDEQIDTIMKQLSDLTYAQN